MYILVKSTYIYIYVFYICALICTIYIYNLSVEQGPQSSAASVSGPLPGVLRFVPRPRRRSSQAVNVRDGRDAMGVRLGDPSITSKPLRTSCFFPFLK